MEKIIEALTKLAETMGQTVETLWPHAVRYTAVNALAWLIAFTLPLIISLIIYWPLRKGEWLIDNGNNPGARLFASIFLGLAIVLFLMAMGENLGKILEPTGYTIQSLMRSQ